MRISLCMIVKDEESVLSRCLSGIFDQVDEIVIVDTGSTDKTKEIAKILDIPDNTVRTRLARARAQLEKYYKE